MVMRVTFLVTAMRIERQKVPRECNAISAMRTGISLGSVPVLLF